MLTLFWLRPQVALNGLLLAGAVAVYLLIFSWRRSFRLAKPWAAALLFTAGVFLVAWSRTPSPYASLAAYALVFFTLCLGNLLLPRLAAPVVFAMMMLAIFCAWQGEASRWFPAAAVGALGLAAVAFFGQRLPGEARALLADAALLIPALRLWTSTG